MIADPPSVETQRGELLNEHWCNTGQSTVSRQFNGNTSNIQTKQKFLAQRSKLLVKHLFRVTLRVTSKSIRMKYEQ